MEATLVTFPSVSSTHAGSEAKTPPSGTSVAGFEAEGFRDGLKADTGLQRVLAHYYYYR
jgi:hypothetical protein